MTDLSVIVLIYNMEELLPRCLDSLERQTKHGIQFILVDDGSKDNSGKICDAWHPKNHTVKVIHKENGGVVAGWMDGVQAADGEYVGFVDSDDYIDDNMYEQLWKAVADHQVDISMCNHCREVDGIIGSTPIAQVIQEGIYIGKEMNVLRQKVLPRIAENYLSPSLCNKIFRKELFVSNFQFVDKRSTIADDVSIVIPCLFSAKSFSYIHKQLYHAVSRKGSVSDTYKSDMYEQHEILLDNLQRAFEFYNPDIPQHMYDHVVSYMGCQWLRMVYISKLSRKEKKKLLQLFFENERYVCAAKAISSDLKNKWDKVYVFVVLKHQYWAMELMMRTLQCRDKVLTKLRRSGSEDE